MSDEEIVDRWISDVHKVTESAAERTHYFHAQIGVTLASGCKLNNENNDTQELQLEGAP